MHENREVFVVSVRADRSGKVRNHKPDMYAAEESDCAIVCAEQRIVQEG